MLIFFSVNVAPAAGTNSPKSSDEIKQARRRLSVMSDNKLVEGFDNALNLEEQPEVEYKHVNFGIFYYLLTLVFFSFVSKEPQQAAAGFIVNSYGGYSKKGYAPYNPKKKNQDALIMAEDPKTRSLLFCVMDGHGEDGDKVSQSIKSKFTSYLFKHKDFEGNIKAALTDVIARCEGEVLRGKKSAQN